MRLSGLTRVQRYVLTLSAIYAAIFIFMLIARPGTKNFYQTFFNVYQILPPIFAAVCNFIYVVKGQHSSRGARTAWLLVGLGCLSFAVGQSTWTYHESILGTESPFPGWPDLGYLCVYPLLIAGVLLLFRDTHVAGRARIFLDSAITASGFAALSWYFMVGRLWESADLSLLGRIISVAYPLGDLALLFMAIVLIRSSSGNRIRRRAIAFLAGGAVLLTFADTVFTYMSLIEQYQTGSWGDWGWSFGYLLIGCAALTKLWGGCEATQASDQLPRRPQSAAVLLWPYAAVLLALGVIFLHDTGTHGRPTIASHSEALALLCLVLARQVAALFENTALTKRLSETYETLEQRVEERTRQLASLQQLTKAVNNTLKVNNVLEEAAVHSQRALAADAMMMWLTVELPDGKVEARVVMHLGFDNVREALDVVSKQPLRTRTELLQFFCGSDLNEQSIACLFAPLIWQERQLGMMCAVRWHGAFNSKDAELLESVGFEVGMALENAKEHAKALDAADRDPVTGLLNHRAVHLRLGAVVQRAARDGASMSVLLLDLNNFKLYNDTYGHVAGDQVLKQVGKVLEAEFPEPAVVGRYGGDEFIVILPRTDGVEADRLAREFQRKLSSMAIGRGNGEDLPISVSCGIASCPSDGEKQNELVSCADWNMYRAKTAQGGIMRSSELQQQQGLLKVESSYRILDSMIVSIDKKDRYTRRHSEEVTEYALWTAQELGLSEETMKTIRLAGLLHDVGKIGVPDEVLQKPGRLTPEEFEAMQRHPVLGSLIVAAVPGMSEIVDGVRSHHERWDGQGYPDQLHGEDIPFLGRLLAVADAFSAMTTDRPYRKGMDFSAALEEVRKNIGTQFDPMMGFAFLEATKKRLSSENDSCSKDKAA